MRGAKTVPIMSLSLVLLAGCCGSPPPAKDPAPNDTAWGPALSEEEKKTIAQLSTTELVDMLRHGDTLHKFAAVGQLTAGEKRRTNFDLLLSLAAQGGDAANIIVEGLVSAVEESAPAEDKRRVDKFLSFLRADLEKDRPAVEAHQAIRSVAQAITRRAVPLPGESREPPYGHEYALRILVSCLDHRKDFSIRADAIYALAWVGGDDPIVAKKVLATLETQRAKEEARQGGNVEKESMPRVMEDAIEMVTRQLKQMTNPYVSPLKTRTP